MADKSQQQNEEDDVLEAELVNENETPKSNNTTWIWVGFVILLLVNIGSYALWYQQQSNVEQLSQQLSQTQELASQSSEIKQLLQSEAASTKAKLTAIESAQQELAETIVTLQENQQLGSAELQWKWAIAELQYLLTVANQRLLLANDIEGAQHALRLADQRAEALDDFRLHSLRALLAEEQLALATVAEVDIEGMVLQLQSALKNVDALQVWMGPEVSQVQDNNSTAIEAEGWQQALSNMWTEIKSMVVIRHKQDGTAAVLVPEQRYFLYQNLRLQLETARYALLSGEEPVFNNSIDAAVNWLEQYFVGDEKDVMSTLLGNMQQKSVKTDLPDISASLTWLKLQGNEQ